MYNFMVILTLTFDLLKIYFFRIWSCCISIKREQNTLQHGRNWFALTRTLWVGSKSQNMLLSGNGHVACQIKDNDTYNKMQAIILSLHAPYTPRVGSKVKTVFSEISHVAC